MRRTALLTGALLWCAGWLAPGATAADVIVVKPVDGVVAPVGAERRVDHAAFDTLLRRYVNAAGQVDYRAWKAADRPALDRYLQSLARVDPTRLADKWERLAFWINAYNALTIKGMLHFHPTPSIKKHTSRFWGFHFWDEVRIEVGTVARSLDHIEHQILRTQAEPRIHFAIVCASVGCPRLRNRAYTGPTLDATLTAAATEFFNDPKHFRIDRGAHTVHASQILNWFGADFGGTPAKILAYARPYLRDAADQAVLQRPDVALEFLDYDWSINEQPAPEDD
jgi:hypothetical protein